MPHAKRLRRVPIPLYYCSRIFYIFRRALRIISNVDRNTIIKQRMNVIRSLLDGIKPNNFNDMDIFKEWKRGDYQKKL